MRLAATKFFSRLAGELGMVGSGSAIADRGVDCGIDPNWVQMRRENG